MILTFPLDMLLSLGLGMAFSIAQGDREKEKKNVFTCVYFLVGLAFHVAVAVGVALLCYLLHPDWMFMYLTRHDVVPVSIVVYIFCGYLGMYVLGFLLVPQLRKLRNDAPWIALFAVLAFVLLFIGLTFHRLSYVGDFASYAAGGARVITGTSLLPVLGISMPLAVGGLAAVLLLLRRYFKRQPAS